MLPFTPIMDIIPLADIEPEVVKYLSDHAQFSRNVSKKMTRTKRKNFAEDLVISTFNILGGEAAFALYMDEHREQFYQLVFKIMGVQKAQVDHSFRVIQPAIPRTALDGPEPIDTVATDVTE